MEDSSSAFTFSLDNLFFHRPVVQKVEPLCKEQGKWKLDTAPEISAIPATQELQKDAESMTCTGLSSSQKPKKFLPPFRRLDVGIERCVQSQKGETEDQQTMGVWRPEMSVRFHHSVSGSQECSAASHNSGRRRLDPTGSQLKTWLFKPPMRKPDSFSIPVTNHHSVNLVAMATECPVSSHTMAASCSPFREIGVTEGFSSVQNNCSIVRPLTPKPIEIQGTSGPGILRPVSEIPAAQFRSVFDEFPYFNYVQSKALDDVLYGNRNFVACAPTGSGKTVLFELAIIRVLMETTEPWHDVKAVYSGLYV